jgi:hypothetical protein
MNVATTSVRMSGFWILAAILGAVGCKPQVDSAIVSEFETPAWAGRQGLLLIKTESEDPVVLLLRYQESVEDLLGLDRRDQEKGHGRPTPVEELTPSPDSQDAPAAGSADTPPAPETLDDETIYRYDPLGDALELEVVDLKAWNNAGEYWTWGAQQARRVPSRIKFNPLSCELNYKVNNTIETIPIKGNVVVHMAKSMAGKGKLLAVLSAKEECSSTGAYLERSVKYTDYHHQVYDLARLEPVGEPVYLPFEDNAGPIGMWIGKNDYVVYHDHLFSKVCIVHLTGLAER